MAAVSAGPGAVEHERRRLVGRQVAGLEQMRVQVPGAGHVATLPASLPVVIEHEKAGLPEPRRDFCDRDLANLHACRLALMGEGSDCRVVEGKGEGEMEGEGEGEFDRIAEAHLLWR